MTTTTPAPDIVERGREHALHLLERRHAKAGWLLQDMATEIEALRAREAELQRKLDEAVQALERVAGPDWVDDQNRLSEGKDINLRREMRAQQAMARRALASIRGEG